MNLGSLTKETFQSVDTGRRAFLHIGPYSRLAYKANLCLLLPPPDREVKHSCLPARLISFQVETKPVVTQVNTWWWLRTIQVQLVPHKYNLQHLPDQLGGAVISVCVSGRKKGYIYVSGARVWYRVPGKMTILVL